MSTTISLSLYTYVCGYHLMNSNLKVQVKGYEVMPICSLLLLWSCRVNQAMAFSMLCNFSVSICLGSPHLTWGVQPPMGLENNKTIHVLLLYAKIVIMICWHEELSIEHMFIWFDFLGLQKANKVNPTPCTLVASSLLIVYPFTVVPFGSNE